jgi:hypothetical protein
MDWNEIANDVRAVTLEETRSCLNCAHAVQPEVLKDFYWWECARLGARCWQAVRQDAPCGLGLRYWAPRPPPPRPWWYRLLSRLRLT